MNICAERNFILFCGISSVEHFKMRQNELNNFDRFDVSINTYKILFLLQTPFCKECFFFKQSISIQNKINKAIGIKSLEIKGTTPIHSFRHVVLVYILSFTLILGAI